MSTQQLGSAHEAWSDIAAGYDQFVAPTEIWLASEALQRAGLRSGERFLDVAAGTGGLSLPAARLGAKVAATDWSPATIERLEARAREEGLAGVSACVMDCHALELDDQLFDLTGSQFGVMLVPDLPLALREMVRVTRRGGRVLLIAYGAPDEIEFLHFFIGALQAVDPEFTGFPWLAPAIPERTLRSRRHGAVIERGCLAGTLATCRSASTDSRDVCCWSGSCSEACSIACSQ